MLRLDSTGMRGEELCQFPSITQELWVPVPAATWGSLSLWVPAMSAVSYKVGITMAAQGK